MVVQALRPAERAGRFASLWDRIGDGVSSVVEECSPETGGESRVSVTFRVHDRVVAAELTPAEFEVFRAQVEAVMVKKPGAVITGPRRVVG